MAHIEADLGKAAYCIFSQHAEAHGQDAIWKCGKTSPINAQAGYPKSFCIIFLQGPLEPENKPRAHSFRKFMSRLAARPTVHIWHVFHSYGPHGRFCLPFMYILLIPLLREDCVETSQCLGAAFIIGAIVTWNLHVQTFYILPPKQQTLNPEFRL